jgi:hypothetical protein
MRRNLVDAREIITRKRHIEIGPTASEFSLFHEKKDMFI